MPLHSAKQCKIPHDTFSVMVSVMMQIYSSLDYLFNHKKCPVNFGTAQIPFDLPPPLPNGHFGALYTPIDLGKQFDYNVIGSQKVAMVLAFEPNFLQNLKSLKQD